MLHPDSGQGFLRFPAGLEVEFLGIHSVLGAVLDDEVDGVEQEGGQRKPPRSYQLEWRDSDGADVLLSYRAVGQ